MRYFGTTKTPRTAGRDNLVRRVGLGRTETGVYAEVPGSPRSQATVGSLPDNALLGIPRSSAPRAEKGRVTTLARLKLPVNHWGTSHADDVLTFLAGPGSFADRALGPLLRGR